MLGTLTLASPKVIPYQSEVSWRADTIQKTNIKYCSSRSSETKKKERCLCHSGQEGQRAKDRKDSDSSRPQQTNANIRTALYV